MIDIFCSRTPVINKFFTYFLIFFRLSLCLWLHFDPTQLLGILCQKVFKEDILRGIDRELVSIHYHRGDEKQIGGKLWSIFFPSFLLVVPFCTDPLVCCFSLLFLSLIQLGKSNNEPGGTWQPFVLHPPFKSLAWSYNPAPGSRFSPGWILYARVKKKRIVLAFCLLLHFRFIVWYLVWILTVCEKLIVLVSRNHVVTKSHDVFTNGRLKCSWSGFSVTHTGIDEDCLCQTRTSPMTKNLNPSGSRMDL